MDDNESTATKNAGELMAISIAMAMQQYDVGRIARWSTSRASLKATGCRHQASACAILSRWPPWSKKLNKTHKTLTKHNFSQHLQYISLASCLWDPLLSLCVNKCEIPRLELESSANFLAIKRCHAGAYSLPIRFCFGCFFSRRFVVCRFCTSRQCFGYSEMKNQFLFMYPKINPLRRIIF